MCGVLCVVCVACCVPHGIFEDFGCKALFAVVGVGGNCGNHGNHVGAGAWYAQHQGARQHETTEQCVCVAEEPTVQRRPHAIDAPSPMAPTPTQIVESDSAPAACTLRRYTRTALCPGPRKLRTR